MLYGKELDSTSEDSAAEALDVPPPDEFVDELVNKRFRRRKKSRFVRVLTHILFYLCALAVLSFGGYQGYLWCLAYHAEHMNLVDLVKQNAASQKYQKDIERTLLVSYEFLSKYEAHYYGGIFNDFSKVYGIPWEMYAALVRIESNFDPSQKSDKGAVGMTQVIESTGKSTAKAMKLNYREDKTLWNDLLNMMIGFTYFSDGYKVKLSEGATRDEALKHSIKRYLGGSDYQKKISSPTQRGKETRIYVTEYNNTVWQEYRRLQYVFKGICADTSHVLDEPVIDTLSHPEE